MKNSKPEKFLDTQELSALESQTLKGGHERPDKKKEKKVETK